MDINEALAFADRLVFEHTGQHLSDLERRVFVGSWEGQTYQRIYPDNPDYVEKHVGYKLWQKLSIALGEKVKKKQFRGALERQLQSSLHEPSGNFEAHSQSVLISYRNQQPDRNLAGQIHQAIAATRHQTFLADVDTSPTTSGWLGHLEEQLVQCSYLILLLSPEATISEMVIEALRRATELREPPDAEPLTVVPIWLNCSPDLPIDYDLCSYLPDDRSLQWQSDRDTPRLLQDLLNLLDGKPLEKRRSQSLAPPPPIVYPPPVPTAPPEIPQGQVRLHSQFYLERIPDEAQCYREIQQPGTLIRIKAPRQMGKTSLMSRILYRAKAQGYRTVSLSFQHADKGVFASLDRLLQWFCTCIARKLHLPHQIDQHWTDLYGSKGNCTAYFEDYLLPEIDAPLVLGLDEVDRVFEHPQVADDFFGLLRAWYEEAGYGDDRGLWEKLRMIVVHSTEVYIPLDVNQSPFNVGLPIALSEFSAAQVQDLVQRHGLNWRSFQVEQLMQMVGGHPHLVRLALYHLVRQPFTLEQLLAAAPTEAGIYGDHLRRHLWRLQQHPELAAAFHKVAIASMPVELESLLAFKLHSMGLVQLHGNEVTTRFELYRQYFRDRLAAS